MAINPINIVPDVTQITITTDDKKLVISGDVVANNVNVSQPLVNTIKVQVPGPQGPVGPVGPEPSTGSLMVTGSVSNNTLTFTKGDGSTFDLTPNSGSFSGSFEGTFTRGRIGDGVIIEKSSTIIRSEGFLGQTSASLGLSPAGFVIYSGSSTTTLGADTLQGTGFKFVGPNNNSFISFTDQNQGDVEIKTDKFTLQNSGDITASNALFSGTTIAQNFLQKSVVVHDTVFEGNPSNFSTYFDQATLSSYNLVLDGGRGGEILNNVEFKLDVSDIVIDDIILLGDETLTEDKAQVTLRVRSDSARGLFFNLRKPDGSSFDQTLTPGNIYTFEISYDRSGTKTTTALTATDLSIPVTASSTGYNISGNVHVSNRIGIGTTTPSKELTIEGDISASGDLSIRDFPSVSSSLASGGKITYDSASGANFDLTNIQVNDYDDNVAINFIDGKLTFTFGTPEVPSSINSSLSGFAVDRFNKVTDNYTINGTWNNGGYTLISASLYEGSTLLEEVGTGTSLAFNTTTSGSHTYRLEYTASSPLDGTLFKSSDTITGTLSKVEPTAPSINRTYDVQLRSGNNIEEGATGSIAFTTSSGQLNGWEYTGGSTTPSTSPQNVTATGTITIQASANYQSPPGDNDPQLTRTKTSTATSNRIRSLRYGASTATSFSELEIQDIDEWVNNIGTIDVGTINPNNQQFTITTSAEYIYIIYDKNQSDLSGILNVNNSNSNDINVFTKTVVGNYNVYRSNNLSTTSILYKLTT